MAKDESIWLATMFMKQYHIRNSLSQTKFNQFFQNCTSSVNSLSVWQDNRQLFGELKQSIGGISWCGDENLRIGVNGIGILIINPWSWDYIIKGILMVLASFFLSSSYNCSFSLKSSVGTLLPFRFASRTVFNFSWWSFVSLSLERLKRYYLRCLMFLRSIVDWLIVL